MNQIIKLNCNVKKLKHYNPFGNKAIFDGVEKVHAKKNIEGEQGGKGKEK